MKKFLFVLSLVTLSSLSYANDIEEDVIKIAEDSDTCCTATLTYNGEYVDHQTSCYASFTYEQNCAWSRRSVLIRNPAAYVAFGN